MPPQTGAPRSGTGTHELELLFKEAKERLIQGVERNYLQSLLERCEGNISRASREARIDRVYLRCSTLTSESSFLDAMAISSEGRLFLG